MTTKRKTYAEAWADKYEGVKPLLGDNEISEGLYNGIDGALLFGKRVLLMESGDFGSAWDVLVKHGIIPNTIKPAQDWLFTIEGYSEQVCAAVAYVPPGPRDDAHSHALSVAAYILAGAIDLKRKQDAAEEEEEER